MCHFDKCMFTKNTLLGSGKDHVWNKIISWLRLLLLKLNNLHHHGNNNNHLVKVKGRGGVTVKKKATLTVVGDGKQTKVSPPFV